MTYDWTVHAATFLILASYQGHGARYRMLVSFSAFLLGGVSLALAIYALLFPPSFAVTLVGLVLLLAVLRCRGNVAKLFALPAKERPNHGPAARCTESKPRKY